MWIKFTLEVMFIQTAVRMWIFLRNNIHTYCLNIISNGTITDIFENVSIYDGMFENRQCQYVLFVQFIWNDPQLTLIRVVALSSRFDCMKQLSFRISGCISTFLLKKHMQVHVYLISEIIIDKWYITNIYFKSLKR